jgi:drug/metabolite transporter (DMT)-like permease
MNYGLLFAILSPLAYAVMNITDKFILSKRIKSVLSYMPVAGMISILFAVILAAFLDWSIFIPRQALLPIIIGIMSFIQFFLYATVLEKEDATSTVGLIYVYPLFVTVLSFVFLKEILSGWGYVGVALTITGAILLSGRLNKKDIKKNIMSIALLAVLTAVSEFMIKVTTNQMPELNAVSISLFTSGIMTFTLLFNNNIRKGFIYEARKNTGFVFLSEIFTFVGILTLFLAMARQPATIVATIATIQPLFVLGFEYFVNRFTNITQDTNWKAKLIPIILIVVGIILLYSFQI